MATTTTNISLTKPELADTSKIREDINSNSDIIDGRFSATYMAVQDKNAVTITGGSITGITDLVVSDGGTGVSTLTDGGVLLGSGTGAVTAMAVLTDGQMIVGNGTTDPVAESGATLRTSIGCASCALDNIASCAINTSLLLGSSDGGALGSATKMWSDLFLASGGVINFNNGNVTLTHSADTLTFTGILTGDGSGLTNVGALTATALTISAKVNEAGGITKGQPVYFSGATGQIPQASLADNTVDGKTCVAGIAAETKTDGQTMLVRAGGQLDDVNTSTYSDGDCLYLSTAGSYSTTVPTSGAIIIVAGVEYSHASQGKLLLLIYRTKDKGAPADTNLITRLGDNAGTYKEIWKDYANNEVAYIDSDGKADFTSLTLDTALSTAEGGTGVSNNAASTITISGNYATTITVTNTTGITLPTSGTLVNTAVTSLSSLATIGTVTSGTLSTGAVLADITMTLGSDIDGDVYYRASNKLTRLAKGTATQVLAMNAGATAPEWVAAAGGGDVSKVGTPVDSQVGVWTGDGTIEGAASLTYDGSNLQLTGDIGSTGTKITKGWFTDLLVINAIAGSITGTARGLVSVSNADITIQPNGTGDTIIYAPSDVVTTVTAAHTMTIAEAGTVLVSCAATPYTITLPTASGHTGLRYHFIKTDANYFLITLDGNGAETFNYESSTSAPVTTYARLNTYCAEVTIVSNGTNWQVIDEAMGQVPECFVYLGTNQDNIPSTTYTLIDINQESYDIGNNFNTTTHIFTVPISGKYEIKGSLKYETGIVSDKIYYCSIKVGAIYYSTIFHSSNTSAMTPINLLILSLSVDDTIALYTYNNDGVGTGDIQGHISVTHLLVRLTSKD